MKKILTAGFVLIVVVQVWSQSANPLRMNQIQLIASHNSYKKYPNADVMRFLMKFKKQLGKDLNPEDIDYNHLPFDSQFTNYAVRGLELDIYCDPKGGRFYNRKMNAFVRGVRVPSHIAVLKEPGLKMLHIKDVDYETNYYTFKDGLRALKAWSDAHPNHLPLMINVETKADGPGDANGFLRFAGFKRSIPWSIAGCDSIDAEIKAVFGTSLTNVVTPDRLRGAHATLEDMVLSNDWPLLDSVRGKIFFIMEGRAETMYKEGHPNLQQRVMFVYADGEHNPDAAFIVKNNASGERAKIAELVQKGYFVRTRADAGTRQSRDNNYSTFQDALESGAQIISTDYYKPDLRFSTYHVAMPSGGAGRLNPVNGEKQGTLTE